MKGSIVFAADMAEDNSFALLGVPLTGGSDFFLFYVTYSHGSRYPSFGSITRYWDYWFDGLWSLSPCSKLSDQPVFFLFGLILVEQLLLSLL